jgi:hypothetical protein
MSVYVVWSHVLPHQYRANEMTSSLDRPLDYPAALLKERSRLPDLLHIVVDELDASGLTAKRAWSNDAFTKQGIEAHLSHKLDNAATSGLISAYESAETALKYRPYTNAQNSKGPFGQAQLLTLSMEGLGPGWMTISPSVHIPVWGQTGPQYSPISNYKANLWICLEEARVVLGLDERLGARGEWLACGLILAARVIKQVKLHIRQPEKESVERVFDDQEKQEADKAAKRERRRREEKMEQGEPQKAERGPVEVTRANSSRSLKPSERPHIPVRKSSLNSLALKVSQVKDDQPPPKLAITTREARISLTYADHNRAASLMKYALLISHGKRLEAETSWLQQTTESSDLGRASSTRTIDNGSRAEEEAESGSVIRRPKQRDVTHRVSSDLDTIPEETRSTLTPSESSRPSSKLEAQQPVNGRSDSRQRRREVQYYVPSRGGSDTHSIQEDRKRNSRSAAPSPSRSMFEHQQEPSRQTAVVEETRERALRTRLSRTEHLSALLDDDDSALAEYARLSLQDPDALATEQRHVSHERETVDTRRSRRDAYSDVEGYRDIVTRQKEQSRHDSASSLTSVPITHHRQTWTHRSEVQQQNPALPASSSVYSSLYLPELWDFEVPHASVEQPPHPHDLERERSRDRSQPRNQQETLGAEKDRQVHDDLPTIRVQTPERTPSCSEPFLAIGKEWKEKGNEIRGRFAELTSKSRTKRKGRKDLWDRSDGDLWSDAGK